NVFVLAMPVKSLVGLIVLIVYLPFLLGLFESEFANGETMWKFLDGVLQ
ncbi:MAG: flagellar biosynthetic protein FliR, partial [Planctomycetaceae bacterium]|nr:flagellar biosynthetic protein FliR [Planctomycetaceae bacterium]